MRIIKCDVCGAVMPKHKNNTDLSLDDVCDSCEKRIIEVANQLRMEYEHGLVTLTERVIADIKREAYEAAHAPV